MSKVAGVALAAVMACGWAGGAKAFNVPVATCASGGLCETQTVPFTTSFSASTLAALGLGTTQTVFVNETSPFFIRLGVLSFDFTTSAGSVMKTLLEFNGPQYQGSPMLLTVGNILIPNDALSLTITGSFGNSTISSSANGTLYFGELSAVPLPASAPMFGAALLALAGFSYASTVARRSA